MTAENAASWERPITEDFYRSPSGEWVYKWSDERLVLKEGPSDDD